MRRRILAALIVTGALGATPIARADCCNDALSCLGAVLSAGLSCQVQAIIDTVKTLQTVVGNLLADLTSRAAELVNDARGSVSQAASDMAQIGSQAAQDLAAAASRSYAIAHPSLSLAPAPVRLAGSPAPGAPAAAPPSLTAQAGPATPPLTRPPGTVFVQPADPAAVKSALQRADAYVQDLKAKQDAMAGEVSTAQGTVAGMLARHVQVAQQMMTAAALEPLRLMGQSLADLLAHPERIFDPSAQIDADVQRIANDIAGLLDRMVGEIVTEANGKLDSVRPAVQQMQDQAQAGQQIADLMDRLARAGTQGDLDALNRAVPTPTTGIRASLRGAILPVGIMSSHQGLVAALARSQPQNLVVVSRHKASISDIGAKWASVKALAKAAPPPVDTTYQQRVDQELSARFRGKSAAEIQRQKQQLVEDAKSRFAGDPKTLQKVLAYIETHAKG
jgi:hypothetical protein